MNTKNVYKGDDEKNAHFQIKSFSGRVSVEIFEQIIDETFKKFAFPERILCNC